MAPLTATGTPANTVSIPRAFTEAAREELEQAASIEGVDEEIAVIRLKLKSILARDPKNFLLIDRALMSLVRLLRAKNRLALSGKDTVRQAVENVIRDVAVPVGIDLNRFLE